MRGVLSGMVMKKIHGLTSSEGLLDTKIGGTKDYEIMADAKARWATSSPAILSDLPSEPNGDSFPRRGFAEESSLLLSSLQRDRAMRHQRHRALSSERRSTSPPHGALAPKTASTTQRSRNSPARDRGMIAN